MWEALNKIGMMNKHGAFNSCSPVWSRVYLDISDHLRFQLEPNKGFYATGEHFKYFFKEHRKPYTELVMNFQNVQSSHRITKLKTPTQAKHS